MTRADDQPSDFQLRPFYPRDADVVEAWSSSGIVITGPSIKTSDQRHYRPGHPLSLWWQQVTTLAMPNRPRWSGFVATLDDVPCGIVEVSPFNRTRSTWRVNCLAVNPDRVPPSTEGPLGNVGSRLLRHCFETIWEARMWLAEVDIEQKTALALYRQNGFQPLAQVTYWEITPDILAEQAKREPDLPNLMAIGNADAQLLYQLDTASMPPLVRQVFDQQIQDFKVEPWQGLAKTARQWMQREDHIRGYVFEPQRKAAIGRFELVACRDKRQYHSAELMVHPAYTWLYPELMSHMARVLTGYPSAPLRITSRDYQPEREEFLVRIQANPVNRTLMLSRSVWHKVREAKPTALEGLQLPEVLAGLQPAGKPIPGRISLDSKLHDGALNRRSTNSAFQPEDQGNDSGKSRRGGKPDTLPGEM